MLAESKDKLLPIFGAFGPTKGVMQMYSVYTSVFGLFASATRESGFLDHWVSDGLANLRTHASLWLDTG